MNVRRAIAAWLGARPRLRRRLLRVVVGLLVGLPVLYGLLRGPLAGVLYRGLVERAAAQGLRLSAGRVAPYGVLGVQLDTLLVLRPRPDSAKSGAAKPGPTPADTLLRAGRLSVALRLRYALLGQAQPAALELSEALLALPDSLTAPAPASRALAPPPAADWGQRLSRAYGRVAPLLAARVRLRQVHLLWGSGPGALHLALDSLHWGGGPAQGALAANGLPLSLHTAGDTLVLTAPRAQLLTAPPLLQRLGLRLGARQLRIHRWRVETGSSAELALGLSATELTLMQPRLSRQPLVLHELAVDLSGRVGPGRLALDSSSRVRLGGLSWQPHLSLELRAGSGADTLLSAHLRGPDTTAQAYIDVLTATGLCASLRGLQAEGRWRHSATVAFDSRRPDTLAFASAMNSRGFRVRRWGSARLTALSDTFTHQPPGTRLRRLIGPANPDYVPLAELPATLPDAVLTSEDPSFRWHRGFSPQAIGESLLQNYRQGRFARGGSTISMQLMKNLYLSGDKHLARKLEEALLVWMLEDGRLVAKDRLLEIYFNIIEWAPDRYGIRQAAEFYFAKAPDQLDLAEAVLLAMVIPRPKRFYIFFNPDGSPREAVAQYRKLIVGLMQRRGLISDDQALMAELLPLRLGPAALESVRERYAHSARAPAADELQLDRELDALDEDDAELSPADSLLPHGPRRPR